MNLKVRLALLNFLEFAVWGAYLTSMGTYLGKIGMASQIGWFYAVQGVVSIFMPALMGIVADRWVPAQRLLGFCHLMAALFMFGAAYMGMTGNLGMVFWIYTLSVAFYMPTLALTNSVAYNALTLAGMDTVKDFPPIRVFGTVGFICMMWFVDLMGFQPNQNQFVASGVVSCILFLYTFTLPACPVSAKGETKSFVVFGEEDQTYGRFESDIFAEENAYFELGIFSARVVRSYYEDQLVITAGVEKEWDAALVRPFLWKVNGGQCSLEEFGFMHDNKLTEDFAISVKPGEYHRFGYETDGKQIRLYVDGELQKEISIPYGPAFVSVVTDTKDEIIIKAVNFAGDVDPVSITLDCQVQGDYTVTLLSGEKGDENSFEEPEKVKNITVNMHGASSEFVYEAPPYSVSALRLKKCEAF